MSFEDILSHGIPLHEASRFFVGLKKTANQPTEPPDETGVLEGQFCAPVEQVLAAMGKQVQNEFETHMSYKVYAQTLRDLSHNAIAEEFEEHAGEEMDHADFLLRRMASLGGPAHISDVQAPAASADPVEIIKRMIRMEQEAIANWRELRQLIGDNNPSAVAIDDYMLKEQEHTDDLWLLLPHTERPMMPAQPGGAPMEMAPQAAPAPPPDPPPAEAPAPKQNEKTAALEMRFKIASAMLKQAYYDRSNPYYYDQYAAEMAQHMREQAEVQGLQGRLRQAQMPEQQEAIKRQYAQDKIESGQIGGALTGGMIGGLGLGALGHAVGEGPGAVVGGLGGMALGGYGGYHLGGWSGKRHAKDMTDRAYAGVLPINQPPAAAKEAPPEMAPDVKAAEMRFKIASEMLKQACCSPHADLAEIQLIAVDMLKTALSEGAAEQREVAQAAGGMAGSGTGIPVGALAGYGLGRAVDRRAGGLGATIGAPVGALGGHYLGRYVAGRDFDSAATPEERAQIAGRAAGAIGGDILGSMGGALGGAGLGYAALRKGDPVMGAVLGGTAGMMAGGAAGHLAGGLAGRRHPMSEEEALQFKGAAARFAKIAAEMLDSAGVGDAASTPSGPDTSGVSALTSGGPTAPDAGAEQYLQQEQAALEAQNQNEAGFYKQQLQQTTQQLQQAQQAAQQQQQQMDQMNQQLQGMQGQIDTSMQQSQQTQQQATQNAQAAQAAATQAMQQTMSANSELMSQQQLAANMRNAYQQLQQQVMQVAQNAPPPATTMEAGMAQAAPMGSSTGMGVQEQAGMPPDQGGAEATGAGQPGGEAGPGAPPGGGPAPGGQGTEAAGGQPVDNTQPAMTGAAPQGEQTPPQPEAEAAAPKQGSVKVSALEQYLSTEALKGHVPTLIGAGVGAAGGAMLPFALKGGEEELAALRQHVADQEANKDELGWQQELGLIKNKAQLGLEDMAQKHPAAAHILGAATGAGVGAVGGTAVGEVLKNHKLNTSGY
jgi:bacterioferritin